jgi:hypothetical protein
MPYLALTQVLMRLRFADVALIITLDQFLIGDFLVTRSDSHPGRLRNFALILTIVTPPLFY